MAEISNLGYAVFGVSDLARWEKFAVESLGLQVGRREAGKLLTLRMDQYAQRIVLEQGADDDLRVAGWEMDTEADLEAYVGQLRERAVKVEAGSADHARARRVKKVYVCEDVNGFRHEFYFGAAVAALDEGPFHSPLLAGAGFNTGPLGMGHLLTHSIDAKASVDFYTKVLGLKVSDHISAELAPGFVLDATFLHTRTGRHHSLATAFIPSDRILNHMMIEVRSMLDVGLAHERCIEAGCTIAYDLGVHPNDEMFSFYVVTPSGFLIEYGWGGVVIDDADWQVRTYDRLSHWGHKPRSQPAAPAA
jgi:2,3-dihydroxybiphenyl 1,2-dioxygenase